MSNITKIGPEQYDVANAYLQCSSVEETASYLGLPQHEVVKTLQTPEVKRYLDGVYLDLGYRNRSKLASVLDKAIDAKLVEAEETGIYTSKDLLELLQFAHKMRMDEIKTQKEEKVADNSTTIQVAQFGEGNYGKLMEKLLGNK